MNYDNMSDEEIKALYDKAQNKTTDYSNMSDEEIKALYDKAQNSEPQSSPYEHIAPPTEPTNPPELPLSNMIDLGAPAKQVNEQNLNLVQPEEGNATQDTSLDLTNSKEAIDNPTYMSDKAKAEVNNNRQQAAKDSGDELSQWTDTEGTKHLPEIGLEDVSFEVIPAGKLGWLSSASPKGELYDNVSKAMFDTGLSREAKILLKLNQGRISSDQALKILKGVPKEDQAEALANRLDLAKNYFREAVGDDSILATKLGKKMEQRKSLIEPFTANSEDLRQASETFGAMKTQVDKEVPHHISTKVLADKLKPVADYYKTDPSPLGSSIRNIMLDLSDKDITVGNALDVRENINFLLRKPSVRKVYKTKETLESIKGTLDNFIKDTVPEDLHNKINSEISKYSETINRKLLGDIIDNNTKSDFAVDWDRVITDAKKEGLSSKVSNEVIPLVKELATRFHNDKNLASIITPESKHANLNALGVWSKLLMETLDKANNATFGVFAKSRYKDNLLIKSIRSSIKNSDTQLDFVDDIVKKGIIPKATGDDFKTKLLEYKPGAKLTGDVNLEPKYVTEKGTIGNNPTDLSLHDAQRKLVDDALGKSENTDKIMTVIDNRLSGKRTESILKSVADRMKADDIAGNQQMLRKIIKDESDGMVKAIQKDLGIKLPPEEAEKIYKLKVKEMLKDCN